MNFCSKCGAPLKQGAKFCHKCGYRFTQEPNDNSNNNETSNVISSEGNNNLNETSINKSQIINPSDIDTDEIQTEIEINDVESVDLPKVNEAENSTEKTYISKRNIVLSVVIICCIIGIGVFIFIGNIISNPQNLVKEFQTAVNKNDTKSLGSILYTSDERLNLDSNGIQPLLQSFKSTPSELTDTVNKLNTQAVSLKNGGIINDTSNLYITKTGNLLIFFPKYKIALKPIYLTITSNIKDADILVNGKNIAKTDSNNFSKQLGPYIPGLYNITGKAAGDFGEMQNETKVDYLNNSTKSNNINILQGAYLQVNSNYNNNEIYVNNADTKKSVNTGDTIGPIAVGAKVYAITTNNGTKIKSSYSTISEEDKTIDLDYSQQEETIEQQKSDINNMITGYSGALANALGSKNSKALQAYMYPGSKLFNQQVANVNSYPYTFYEVFDSAVVDSYTMNPDGKSGTVTATEVFDINENTSDPNSRTKTRTFQNVYKFQFNETTQSFQLTERTNAVEK